MTEHHSGFRNFRGGNWDLRKIDRRKEQLTIEFPDRRKDDRRNTDREQDLSPAGILLWVDQSHRDE